MIWHPPSRPRIGRLRRWSARILMVLLWLIIGGYWYLSDSQRVRAMAEAYLSQLIGGRVEVRQARLSMFEGLRLDGVKLYVDPAGRAPAPDALLFSAATVQINYNIESILSGSLAATDIVAIDPQVQLCENVQTGAWNYQRLVPPPGAGGASGPRHTFTLPNISLRNGRLVYRPLQDGTLLAGGTMLIDGILSPTADARDTYAFRLQSRGESSDLGPNIVGTFHSDSGLIDASLSGLGFTPDMRDMLPRPVRQWWEDHEPSGRVDIPVFRLEPSPDGAAPGFYLVAQFTDVSLTLPLQRGGPAALGLRGITGRLTFRPQGIDIQDFRGTVAGNVITAAGHIDGYDAAAPLQVTLESPRVVVPDSPPILPALPAPVRSLYAQLQPHGVCGVHLTLERQRLDQPLRVAGVVNLLDFACAFDKFPYPLRQVTGKVEFATDPANSRNDYCKADLRGLGVLGGPNEHTAIAVTAFLSPLDTTDEVTIDIVARGITSEATLLQALPPNVRQVLTMFDAPGKGALPRLHGDVTCHLTRAYGLDQPMRTRVALDLDSADLTMKAFPFPLRGLAAKLVIDDIHTEIQSLHGSWGDATLSVTGRVDYPPSRPVAPRLDIEARNLPIDADLLGALPASIRERFAALGLSGRLDVSGRILPGDEAAGPDAPVGTDFTVAWHDGAMSWTPDAQGLTAIGARMNFDGHRLTLGEFHGRRGQAELTAAGSLWLQDNRLQGAVDASARNVTADDGLRRLLPGVAQDVWDQVRPTGTLDAQVRYDTRQTPSLVVTIQPRKMAVDLRVLSYPLDELAGTLKIAGPVITFDQVSARHGEARLSVSGTGALDASGAWDLKLHAENLALDAELRRALPPALAKLLDAVKARGNADVNLARLAWQAGPAAAPEVHVTGRITLADAALNGGVEMTDINGVVQVQADLLRGRLDGLQGQVDLSSLKIAGWAAQNLQASVLKLSGQDTLRMDTLQVQVAGGQLAGQATVSMDRAAPGRFALALVLRDADVRELGLVGGDPPPFGRLSASLALEGVWGADGARRGRGDVSVRAARMYQLPLVLGLMQITNLALPITSPFSQADAGYSVEGPRVTFDHVELRADNMVMRGGGWLDYGTRQVRMTFTTDNPRWPTIPLVNELLVGVQHELLQIHVSGTVQKPQVSARTLNFITTTVDQVTRGSRDSSSTQP